MENKNIREESLGGFMPLKMSQGSRQRQESWKEFLKMDLHAVIEFLEHLPSRSECFGDHSFRGSCSGWGGRCGTPQGEAQRAREARRLLQRWQTIGLEKSNRKRYGRFAEPQRGTSTQIK